MNKNNRIRIFWMIFNLAMIIVACTTFHISKGQHGFGFLIIAIMALVYNGVLFIRDE